MKRRRFLQLAASAAAGAAVRTTAFASLNHDQEVFLVIRDQSLGAGDAVRVRAGERVRFHFVHAGGSEDVHLHLPGHLFTVIALDGNRVPTPAAVDVLSLARGERIEAIVEMNNPAKLDAWLAQRRRAGGRAQCPRCLCKSERPCAVAGPRSRRLVLCPIQCDQPLGSAARSDDRNAA